MIIIECMLDALSVLRSNKLRSFLTSFGLAVGIAIVIVILSVANCVSDVIGIYYASLEEGNYFNVSVSRAVNSVSDDRKQRINITLEQCMEFNSSELPDDIYGVTLRSPANHEAEVYSESIKQADIVINGISPADEHIKQLYINTGRFITDNDCHNKRSTVVISDTLAKSLYGSPQDAVSKIITIKSSDGIMFTGNIVGVYVHTETENTSSLTTDVYCAYSFVNELFSEQTEKEYSSVKIAYKKEKKPKGSSVKYITDFFSRYIENDGYRVEVIPAFTQQESMNTIINLVTAVFTVIAMIIFIVSGIGLMNTLLISVTERTSEIGICKALGSNDRNIVIQFLSEAFVLSLIGVIGGIIIGYFTDFVVQLNLKNMLMNVMDKKYGYVIENSEMNVSPSFFAVIISSFTAMAIGLFFGVRPAKKAMQMNPIDALRTE